MSFFESWQELLRISISALILYPFVILSVRITGKRSTSKMNNFDWIVTVAMGSMVGSGILLKDVVIADAMVAISLLLGFQYIVTKISSHSDFVSKAVHASPTLLYYNGTFLTANMKKERLTQGEIESVVRTEGYSSLSEIGAVIIETDASLSVLPKIEGQTDLLDKVLKPNAD